MKIKNYVPCVFAMLALLLTSCNDGDNTSGVCNDCDDDTPIVCEGNECDDDPPVDCEGDDCDDDPPVDCEGDDCDDDIPVNCEGDDCDGDTPVDCEGDDCDDDIPVDCEGDDCDDDTPVVCDGDDCEGDNPIVCEGDECDDISNAGPLDGTSWKLVGVVDDEVSLLRELEPKNCDRCYVIQFGSGRVVFPEHTFYTFSSSNHGDGFYSANYETHDIDIEIDVTTEAGEVGDGWVWYDMLHAVESFSLQEDELRLYYNENKSYLLFESHDLQFESHNKN